MNNDTNKKTQEAISRAQWTLEDKMKSLADAMREMAAGLTRDAARVDEGQHVATSISGNVMALSAVDRIQELAAQTVALREQISILKWILAEPK